MVTLHASREKPPVLSLSQQPEVFFTRIKKAAIAGGLSMFKWRTLNQKL